MYACVDSVAIGPHTFWGLPNKKGPWCKMSIPKTPSFPCQSFLVSALHACGKYIEYMVFLQAFKMWESYNVIV